MIARTLEEMLNEFRGRIARVERRLAKPTGGSSGDGGTTPYDAQPGLIVPFSGGSVPSGWLLCDGSAKSRAGYPDLYAVIGTTWGAGDGSTTFNVPDGRGRVLVGRDPGQTEFDTLGETGGAKAHTLTVAEMPSHTHAQTFATNAVAAAGGSSVGGMTSSAGGAAVAAQQITSATGGGAAHNNLQPYAVANYLISTGSGLGGGGTNVPAVPDPVTRFSAADTNTVTQAVAVWGDVVGCAATLVLPYACWVQVDFGAQISGSATGYGMIGVNASGALTLLPETDQVSGAINKYGLTPFATNSNIKQHGQKVLLLPAGTTTLTLQNRKSGTPNPSTDYASMIVTPLAWVGAPGPVAAKTTVARADRASALSVVTGSTFILMTGMTVSEVVGGVSFAADKFTVTQPGLYLIDGRITYAANATGNRTAAPFINGASGTSGNLVANAGANSTPVAFSSTHRLVAGDIVDLRGWQTSGAALNASSFNLNLTRISD